ncbi:MAG: FkbH like protein, partial [Pseudomonadota bacterium]
MRTFLPEVQTVEVGSEAATYASTLAAKGAFNLIKLTQEDRDRSELYRAQAARAEASASLSLEDYLTSLDSRLTLEPISDLNAVRITQLFGKTNQFNLTGRRFSESELRAGGAIRTYGARLADRFGDNGLISAITLTDGNDG